ncbi:hypothetical protein BFP72_04460 [Reichenbachiella sp. 5M10]|nr:hypothetical protein BFP72_04460 [Reichenbachiella sp. 5M10]
MSYFSIAQDTTKQKEIGLLFSNLDSFGLTFKMGTDRAMWRFNTLSLKNYQSKNESDSIDSKDTSNGVSVQIGREYRKEIVDNLELRVGADISFSYSSSKHTFDNKRVDPFTRQTEITHYTPGINLVLGFNYVFKESLVFGVELLPGFTYSTGTQILKDTWDGNVEKTETDLSSYSVGLSNSAARLSVSYRF